MHLRRDEEEAVGLQGQEQLVSEVNPVVIAAASDSDSSVIRGELVTAADGVLGSPPSPPPTVDATVLS